MESNKSREKNFVSSRLKFILLEGPRLVSVEAPKKVNLKFGEGLVGPHGYTRGISCWDPRDILTLQNNAARWRATCRVALGMKTGPIENFSMVLSVLAASG